MLNQAFHSQRNSQNANEKSDIMKAQLIVKGLKTESSPHDGNKQMKLANPDPVSLTVYRHHNRKKESKESS